MSGTKRAIAGAALLISSVLLILPLHSYLFNWGMSFVKKNGLIETLNDCGFYPTLLFTISLVMAFLGLLLLIIGLLTQDN